MVAREERRALVVAREEGRAPVMATEEGRVLAMMREDGRAPLLRTSIPLAPNLKTSIAFERRGKGSGHRHQGSSGLEERDSGLVVNLATTATTWIIRIMKK